MATLSSAVFAPASDAEDGDYEEPAGSGSERGGGGRTRRKRRRCGSRSPSPNQAARPFALGFRRASVIIVY